MNTKLEKLMFRIGVLDKASGPLGKLDRQMRTFNQHAVGGGALLAGAAAGAWALQRAMAGVLRPAIEMNRALASVRTLDVDSDVLRNLEQSALRFSVNYGASANEFVRASYDIQSAIGGLQGNELSKFTEASAILAKGTLADTGTITDYIGTLYGIFKNTADKIGKANWVEIAAGQTATAVQMFKTNGAQMAAAFSSIGAAAQAHGIQMAEQMAVLGKLQTTMSGSEAGTKYQAFLRGIGRAQEELGLQFTDSHNRMLPMPKILDKLQGRLAGLGSVAQDQILKKAFGSDEATALIKQLMLDTAGLAGNIQSLQKIQGMDKAQQMAAAMTDQFERWNAAVSAVAAAIGKSMLPVMTPMIDAFSRTASNIVRWTDQFPHLAKAIGLATATVLGLIGSVVALAAVGGLLKLTLAGLAGVKFLWVGMTWAATKALKAGRIAVLLYQLSFKPKLMTLWGVATKGAAVSVRLLSTVLKVASKATLLFSAALWANPITWVVVAVGALIGGLFLLVRHWDTVKAVTVAFIDRFVGGWRRLRSSLESNPVLQFLATPLLAVVDLVGLTIKALQKIPQWFGNFKSWLAKLNIFAALGQAADWLIHKLNFLPGINIQASAERQRAAMPTVPLPQFQPSALPVGGISQQITNNRQRDLHIEKIELHQPIGGRSLVDELEMAAG